MTDRELLELAAKAAWIYHPRYIIDGMRLGWNMNDGISSESGPTSHRLWNPLTDDGDALQLAVKLKIHISGFFDKVTTDTDERSFCENYGADQYAATRRAIVRAAASIGENL